MDQSPLANEAEAGFFPRLGAALFGAKAKRLREQASRTHLLSYLLIIAQSITTILVFGLTEVDQAISGSLVARIIAVVALAMLTITVLGQDIAFMDTMKRIQPLVRNRQHGQAFEHIAYVFFVLLVEGITYGVVLYTLDSNPRLFTSGQPLIPETGSMFIALVVLRVTMISWAALQLIVVRSKLPVELSTLMNTGKEIVGAHVEQQLKALKIAHIPVRATFGVYARMTQAPRPVAGILNALTGGWIVKRALAREAEEARQAQNISAALADLDTFTSATSALPAPIPASTSQRLTPDQMGIAAEKTIQLTPPIHPTAFAQSATMPHKAIERALSPREQRRLALEADMYGVRGHPTSPRESVAYDDLDGMDEFSIDELGDDWQDEDERMLRNGHLPEMSQRSAPKRAQAAHMAPAEATLTVREFVMPDLPSSRYEQPEDSDHARAVLRVLEQDPRATRKQVAERAGVSDGTARRYIALWHERRTVRGRKRAAPRTQEMAAITPEMIAK